jgi:hypothetical protein
LEFGVVAGGLLAGAPGADGYLGGIEKLGGFSEGEDFKDEAVGHAGDEGVDGVGVVGEDGHGVAPCCADALEGFGSVVFARVVDLAGMAVGIKAALDGGFRSEHGWFLSKEKARRFWGRRAVVVRRA